MAMHKTNSLLKFVLFPVMVIFVVIFALYAHRSGSPDKSAVNPHSKPSASRDSAAESLETLTAQLTQTQKHVKDVVAANESLQQQNTTLQSQLKGQQQQSSSVLSHQLAQLKSKVDALQHSPDPGDASLLKEAAQPITTVSELADTLENPKEKMARLAKQEEQKEQPNKKPPPVPYYTIPANATAVEDRLMTPLIGRIPIKGVVTDPYPFKIVFSDNTLAANGLRVPNLKQLIVSGYTEGDLNLLSARGWVTSLTFVFTDGTISTTSSNDNNIGKFTKENALGYLSDEYGNPAIRGQLITNAPAYLGINVALGAAQGAANAYAQSQTTTNSTLVGTNTSSITGSQTAYIAGQSVSNASSQVQQWWHDRQENSFDAIFVPTLQSDERPQKIVVNFAKEIHIDYDPVGRKLVYAHTDPTIHTDLD